MVVMRLLVCEAIQPERLNAESDSPSAFSRGWSISVTPGMPVLKEKRLEDANVVAKVADIRVLRIIWVGTIPRVTLRSTLGYEPLAALGHSTFQVVLLRG